MHSGYTLLLVALLFAIFYFWRRSGQAAAEKIPQYLRDGALIIDVRTPAEYNSGHLPKAINIPLQQIEAAISHRCPDRSRILLLHCHSGARSGVAARRLKAKGYHNTFNLGSYHRAGRLIKGE
jgi:phage shock protein E